MQSEYTQGPIAVVGLACRLPGNNNSPTEFWDFLLRGGCAENEPPITRFNFKGHFDGSRKPGTMRSPGGMFLENIDPRDIDALFFGLSKADAISMDPQHRQLLETVYEALENSGISLQDLKGQPFGCFVGSFASDYTDIQLRDPEDRTTSFPVGLPRAMLSNRISHFLDIKGPSMTIDTACSGTLTAVDLACRYLETGDINGAIVGGCNLYMSPEWSMDESAMKFSGSLTGQCKSFDAKADGYIKAEAVNALVLKRLEDALRDGDPIRSVIRGSFTNSDGWTPRIVSPSAQAQAIAIRGAYARAKILDFQSTSYVECHGTGTKIGDPVEVAGVSSVFAPGRPADKALIIGSVKSNIGHSEPASGISGMIKTILALEKSIIPGTPTFETPNPKIDFQASKVRVSRVAIPWPPVPFRRASVNSFGYGGSNAHVVLDEPSGFIGGYTPNHVSSYKSNFNHVSFGKTMARSRVLVFSANDGTSLKTFTQAMINHLENPSVDVKLQDLAYTLSERRTHHVHRAYAIASNTSIEASSFRFGKTRANPTNIGFVLTGQGAQWSMMGKGLIGSFGIARTMIVRLDKALQSLADPPTWSLLDELVEARTPEHLRLPEFSQPLSTAIQLGILAVLDDWGLRPKSVLGHSSGEIAASYAAGYLTPEEAIKNAYFRGQTAFILKNEEKVDLGMLAVGLGHEQVLAYMDKSTPVQVACINSPSSTTLSGPKTWLEDLQRKAQAQGHFARLLQIDFAYHSDFMQPLAEHYKNILDSNIQPSFAPRDIQMFSSTFGSRMEGQCDSTYWQKNMISPVLFQSALEEMVKDGVDFLIEIGPSGTLGSPILQIKKALGDQGTQLQYFAALERNADAADALLDVTGQVFLSGGSINMSKVNDCGMNTEKPLVIVDLPNYVWNHSIKYWHESDASKDWRYRRFPHHDLLGSKVLGTSWLAPTWKKILKVNDLSWMKDHRIGQDIVFPGAGFIAMAVEAIYQTLFSLDVIDKYSQIFHVSYALRNVKFLRALVIGEDVHTKIFSSLNPCSDLKDSWYEFKIFSSSEDVFTEHCRGQIRLLKSGSGGEIAPKSALEPFKHSTSVQRWYKAMNDVGYGIGQGFQKQLEVESVATKRESRVRISFTDPESTYAQSTYPMHPVSIDSCLQSGLSSLWQGYGDSIDVALVPAVIDDIVIRSYSDKPLSGIAVTTSEYSGTGSLGMVKNYKTNVTVYDPISSSQVFRMSGLNYSELDTQKDVYGANTFTHLSWKPDVSFSTQDEVSSKHVSIVQFSSSPIDAIKDSLSEAGWELTLHHFGTLDIQPESCILVLDEIFSPILSTLTEPQWKALKELISSRRKILWVTSGSLFEVTDPQKALFHGFARSARAEDPGLVLKTLDVESSSMESLSNTCDAINKVLRLFQDSDPDLGVESEYCERRGTIYTSRVLPDDLVNQAESSASSGAPLLPKSLHGNSNCVRIQCERVGAIDSLQFSEKREEVLKEGFVEVEIYAAGVSYKDVAVTLGLVPGDHHLLANEGAGIIRKVGKGIIHFKIGDRVLVNVAGCIANRVQAPVERIHALPDGMSYVEAATLCTGYLTSMHALIDLANLHPGQSVLIHSAADDVGIAAIHICKYLGAEIFATVGAAGQRGFLFKAFNIPPSHIFLSHSSDFAPKLMHLTENKGVDVILNSLTGDLLDVTWRCVADGGVMLEIGKKDILARSTISMEPFARNASFRAIDMSHRSITDPMIASLLTRMFKLIQDGHLKPISPVKVFSFSNIPDAFRYLQSGKHGKVIIEDDPQTDISVHTRPLTPVLRLRSDASYLIIGGLKGICGSLAVYLARIGGTHLVALSRSGYQDAKSQKVLRDLEALGTHIDLFEGDVSKIEDVRHIFEQAKKPIVGVIQGAMVLRDKTLPAMELKDFHEAINPKVQGTLNIHAVTIERNQNLDFFTLLSSISGVIGQKAQSNYAAANVFLDSFAAYRQKLGFPACSVDLGAVEDVGYISGRKELSNRIEKQSLTPINERLLHKILKFSILQQTDTINPASATQMITGIPVPLNQASELLRDARFAGLDVAGLGGDVWKSGSEAVHAFLSMAKAKIDHTALLTSAVELVNGQITKSLGLSEPMEARKALSLYGLDSLVAVELRNWIRLQLGVEITTLEILGATTLSTLCEKILSKLVQV